VFFLPSRRVLAIFLLLAGACTGLAQSTLIPLTTRRGMVFDQAGTHLYITTSDGFVRPYNLITNQLEAGYNLGGSLNGVDIAADDSFLLVAQGNVANGNGVVHRLDLMTGVSTDLTYPLAPNESGAFDVAIGSNNVAMLTTSLGVQGWTPLRQIDLATNVIQERTDVHGSDPYGIGIAAGTRILRSASRVRLYFLEGLVSAGAVFTYDVAANLLGPNVKTSISLVTAGAAVNRDGTILGSRFRSGASFETPDFKYIRAFSAPDGGVAFDAMADRFYAVETATDQIIAYETNTYVEQFRIDIGETLAPDVTQFGTGTLVASQDGKYLALETPAGIRVLPIPSPLPTPPGPKPLTFGTGRQVVFSHSGSYLYITTAEGLVQRYNFSTGQIDANYDLGGSLNGADISADDSFLLVAQNVVGLTQGMFQKLDLQSGNVTVIDYPLSFAESGGWDVAIAANGIALVTTRLNGIGPVPFRQIDPSSVISVRTDIPINPPFSEIEQDAQVRRSADGTLLYILQDFSPGVFLYSSTSNTFGPGLGIIGSATSSAAVNRNGTLVATRSYLNSATIRTAPAFQLLHTFITNGLDGALAFDGQRDMVYGVNSFFNQIVACDTNTFAEMYRLNIGEEVPAPLSRFGQGVLAASPDGQHLALITPTTVRVFALPSPTPIPAATPTITISSSGQVTEGGSAAFTVTASSNTARPVAVNYAIGGSAAFGTDYTVGNSFAQAGAATIPVGQNSVSIPLAVVLDQLKEKKETITMTLAPGSGYAFGAATKKKKPKPPSATVTIAASK
jgi:hypothetical protein